MRSPGARRRGRLATAPGTRPRLLSVTTCQCCQSLPSLPPKSRLRRAGRPTSTSRPAGCWQNKHQLKQRRKCLHVVDKAVGVAVPTHAASPIFQSWRRETQLYFHHHNSALITALTKHASAPKSQRWTSCCSNHNPIIRTWLNSTPIAKLWATNYFV